MNRGNGFFVPRVGWETFTNHRKASAMSIKPTVVSFRVENDLATALERAKQEFDLPLAQYGRVALRNQARRDGFLENRREPAKD